MKMRLNKLPCPWNLHLCFHNPNAMYLDCKYHVIIYFPNVLQQTIKCSTGCSMYQITNIVAYKWQLAWRHQLTLTAMIVLLISWYALLTVPYAPRPISPWSVRSSAVKSYVCNNKCYVEIICKQGSKLWKRISFRSEMLQKILPFRLNFNLPYQKTSAF